MRNVVFKRFVFRTVSVMIVSMGFIQISNAGVIGTQRVIDGELRGQQISRIERFLARRDVAEQLAAYGVPPESILQRLQHMTEAELAALDGKLDEHVVGGDALTIIGAVFLVLLILELVGVTDIFKSI